MSKGVTNTIAVYDIGSNCLIVVSKQNKNIIISLHFNKNN